MGAYEYQALDSAGKLRKGVLQGDTSRQIRQQLREKGLSPLDVSAISNQRQTMGRQKDVIKSRELAILTRQLASLVNAGLPLEDCVATLAEQSEKASTQRILAAVRSRVVEGHSLSSGLMDHPASFPPLYTASVSAGEQSGHLGQVLGRLADFTERREEITSKLIGALIYPVIMALTALAVITALMLYVIPKVVQVFDSLDQQLPTLTRIMIGISEFFQNHILAIAVILLLLFVLMPVLLQIGRLKRSWHGFLLRLPVIGRLSRGTNAGRFTRTMSILTASAVPLVDALGIARGVMSNLRMRDAIGGVAERVREGSSFSQALKQTRLFAPITTRLIASGEKSGQLDDMLERAAEHQEREVDNTLTVLMGILEPAMILIVGVIVLLIVLAILLPILQINQLIA